MKGGFNPLLVGQILLNWIYLSYGVPPDLHHIVPQVNEDLHTRVSFPSFIPKNSNASAQIQHPENEQEIMLSQIGRKNDFIRAPLQLTSSNSFEPFKQKNPSKNQ